LQYYLKTAQYVKSFEGAGVRMRTVNQGLLALLCAVGVSALGPAASAADIASGWRKAPPPPQSWAPCRKPAVAPEANKFPDVPGDDIFGFTSPTDVGNPGDCAIAFEFSGAAGRSSGRYHTGTLKTEFSATIAENVFVAVSPFVTYHHIRGVDGFDDLSRARFDGLSGELGYRFIERSANNPVAATFSVEPRWARLDVDNGSGLGVTAYLVELKLFLDSVIVAERLYAAINLNYAPAIQKFDNDPLHLWNRLSGLSASGALTYQISGRLFAGAEIRHLTAFEGIALEREVGQALFAGPTILVKLSDTTALNVVWTPQLWGRATGSRGSLDLDNFERHQFRLKLAVGF
jgi:hypothetical protein